MFSKDTVLYDGKKWFLYITRNVSFWANCLSAKGSYFHFKDFGIPTSFPFLVVSFDGTESHHFAFEPTYTKSSNIILSSCLGKARMSELQKKYEIFGAEFLSSLEKCREKLTVENWQAFTHQYARYAAGLNLTAILGRVGATALTEKLKALGVAEEKIPETISAITYPEKHTPLFLSQQALYILAGKSKLGKITEADLEKELQKWLAKHEHIPVNFTGEPWTIENARKQFEEIRSKNVEEELEKMEEDHVSRVKKATETLRLFRDRELTDLATTISHATFLNEYRKDIFSKVSLGFRPIFQKIAELGGSKNWRDCFFLTPSEMTALLRGEKISIADKKKERAVVAVRIKSETELDVLDRKDALKFSVHIKNLLGGDSVPKESSFKGYSASKGKVAGIVKVIFGPKDFDKMNTGDILVAPATSVDFVPIMQKASAFVTNEGGITSHASIVSREMGKACIIGTKIATKVLKDGDLVEVDAERGVVTILKKANDK